MDTYSGASAELIYESTATTKHSSNCHFCVRVHSGSRDCEYSWFLQNCSNCFGCVGLKDKEYCIFNKQYTKEEYFGLLKTIKSDMIEAGEYGEFFPFYTSPFAYNDTVAQEYFPLDEVKAKGKGLLWGDIEEKKHQATMSWDLLPDNINEVSDSITREIVSCQHDGNCLHGCTKAFKIVPEELAYYTRKGIPLPRECPNCRYYRRLVYRNPTELRDITCMCMRENQSNSIYKNTVSHEHGALPCGKNISTTIPPDSELIIYCDECYKKEVF
jgi:uncharacterized Fe-S cluster protein YjdI